MPDKPFATGQCQCGAVSYTIAAPPLTMGQCHCKDCQRVTGTGHISLARFNRSDVTIEGTTKTFAVKADSGNINTRHFCPDCGSRLFGENSALSGHDQRDRGLGRRQQLVLAAAGALQKGAAGLGHHD